MTQPASTLLFDDVLVLRPGAFLVAACLPVFLEVCPPRRRENLAPFPFPPPTLTTTRFPPCGGRGVVTSIDFPQRPEERRLRRFNSLSSLFDPLDRVEG